MSPAGDFDYDGRGAGYARWRRADPRIEQLVHARLVSARSVVNVGAGAGSYEPRAGTVVAVEPSAVMRSERPRNAPPVVDAVAEALPFGDASFDAAMAMVTVHQWRDVDRGLRELRRVSRGPMVILTFDGDALDRFWLAEYAPELIEAERRRYPALDHISAVLGGSVDVIPVPIPVDCADGFTEAYYARPEVFLQPAVRAAQSAWGFVTAEAEARAVEALRRDLASGRWDERHGYLRTRPTYLGSLRLVVAEARH